MASSRSRGSSRPWNRKVSSQTSKNGARCGSMSPAAPTRSSADLPVSPVTAVVCTARGSRRTGSALTEELDPRSNRVVAVTGAGTGIGQAIAAKFGAVGWRVAVGGRRLDRLAETVPLVEDAGGTCLPHELDVTDGDSVERFFADVESEFGP